MMPAAAQRRQSLAPALALRQQSEGPSPPKADLRRKSVAAFPTSAKLQNGRRQTVTAANLQYASKRAQINKGLSFLQEADDDSDSDSDSDKSFGEDKECEQRAKHAWKGNTRRRETYADLQMYGAGDEVRTQEQFVLMRRTFQLSKVLYQKYRIQDSSKNARTKLQQVFKATMHSSRTITTLADFLKHWLEDAQEKRKEKDMALEKESREKEVAFEKESAAEWEKLQEWLGEVTENVCAPEVEGSIMELFETVDTSNRELYEKCSELRHACTQMGREFQSLLGHCQNSLLEAQQIADEIAEAQEAVRALLASFMVNVNDLKDMLQGQVGDQRNKRRHAVALSEAPNVPAASKAMIILKRLGSQIEEASSGKSKRTSKLSVRISVKKVANLRRSLEALESHKCIEEEEQEEDDEQEEEWYNAVNEEESSSDAASEEDNLEQTSQRKSGLQSSVDRASMKKHSTLKMTPPRKPFVPSSFFNRRISFFETFFEWQGTRQDTEEDDGFRSAVSHMQRRVGVKPESPSGSTIRDSVGSKSRSAPTALGPNAKQLEGSRDVIHHPPKSRRHLLPCADEMVTGESFSSTDQAVPRGAPRLSIELALTEALKLQSGGFNSTAECLQDILQSSTQYLETEKEKQANHVTPKSVCEPSFLPVMVPAPLTVQGTWKAHSIPRPVGVEERLSKGSVFFAMKQRSQKKVAAPPTCDAVVDACPRPELRMGVSFRGRAESIDTAGICGLLTLSPAREERSFDRVGFRKTFS